MPRTLDKTYDRVLSAIHDEYSDEVKLALYWLAFSARPITVAELAEACSIRIGHNAEPSLEDGGYEAITGLLDFISSFVLLEKQDDMEAITEASWPRKFVIASYRHVRLAHFSVKEYLISDRLRDREARISKFRLERSLAERKLSQMCCAYFLSFTDNPGIRTWINEEKPRKGSDNSAYFLNHWSDFAAAFPLLDYACEYWYQHQRLAESQSGLLPENQHLYLQLLEREQVRVAWLRLYTHKAEHYMDDYGSNEIEQIGWHDGTQALYWAVLLGFRETATILYDREPKPDVNHVAGKYGFPLQAAVFMGDYEMTKLLIGKGADPNLAAGYYSTALQAAAKGGDEQIVKSLLQAGADPNLEGGYYGTALQAAIEGNYENIVEILLQAGADPNHPVKGRRSFMLHQVQINATDTLLLLAAKRANAKMIQMMIQSGANINLTSSELISNCIRCESVELIQTLLQATGINDSMIDEWLMLAVRQAHKGIIKLLIEAGANPNSSNSVHSIAAGAILQHGEKGKAAVDLLLEAGLKVSGDHHLLFAAIRKDLGPMVEFLLLSGVDIHGHNNGDGDALMTAAGCGNDAFVKALLGSGANPKAQHPMESSDMRMHSALIRAMIYGIESLDSGIQRSLAIVQQLVNAGVDVNDGGHALCEAIVCLYTEHLRRSWGEETINCNKSPVELIVQCLLINGADPGGPLGTIPSVICAAPCKDTMDLVLFMFRNHDNRYRRQLLDDMHHTLREDLDMHRRIVTSCTMVAHNDTIMLLEEEVKTKTPDLARVCEILSAACWSLREPRRWPKPEEKEDRLRDILQIMVDAIGPGHSLFDRLLTGDTLGRCMNLYMRQLIPCENSVTKVRARLTEILSEG